VRLLDYRLAQRHDDIFFMKIQQFASAASLLLA
jgi:hypothetical protein